MNRALINRFLSISLLVLLVLIPATPIVSYGYQADSNLDDGLGIILMIGDGMGFEQVKLARWVEVGEDGELFMDKLSFNSSVTTHSASSDITDSAASATAIATGVKTNNGIISQDPSGQNLETILEIAQRLNKSTGVVSTCYLQHATPAAFMTHVNNRNSYNTINNQIVNSADVDVLLGGGNAYFSTADITTMESTGYSIAYTLSDMNTIGTGKILGLFSSYHMDYELDRDTVTTPSLAEMTNKSLNLLDQDPEGFFLMVEGGRIDHAGHDNNKTRNALDTIAFDQAVGVALNYVKANDDTILIVTADHETGGLTVVSNTLGSTLPSEENTEGENRQLRVDRVNDVEVTWSSSGHTATNVPLLCYGSVFDGMTERVFDNTEIFDIMASYFPTPSSLSTTTTTPPPETIDLVPYLVIGTISIVAIVVIFVMRRRM